MNVIHERCCGLDVHKATVTACLTSSRKQETRTFATTTEQLRGLALWLTEEGCSYAVMESTGVYWKPVYNVLELAGIEANVVNAHHIKAVPGRKTDVNDAEWISDLGRHGLVRPSFIPDRPQRELQELLRYRRSLITERVAEVNRVQKVLEGANIKLASVVSNVMGVSARAMLEAIVTGENDPDTIITHIRSRLKATPEELTAALQGFVGDHQRMMLGTQLAHVDLLNEKIADVDDEVERRMMPYERTIQLLDTIPGIGRTSAQEILAAIGTDMSRFPTSAHLASWAKLCPGNNESAGRRRSTKTGKGNPFLRAALAEAAKAAAKSKNTYLRSLYHRLSSRRGPNKASIAVAHSILVSAYHIIKEDVSYRELGPNYLDKRNVEATARRLMRRLQKLGVKVTIEPAT